MARLSFLRIARRPSNTALAALGVFAIALALRLVWVSFVDSPYDNIFSDMAGYINRALQVAYDPSNPLPIEGDKRLSDVHAIAASAAGVDPWSANCPLYPPGAHLVYAAEMKLVGWTHHAAMLVLNCVWGALVAPCAMLLARRVVRGLGVAVAVGLFMALWYPLLAFCGFFSSEQPYAGALALSIWLLVRQIESGKGAISLGLASSVAYLVRPQIVLTMGVLSLVGLFLLWRRPPRAPRLRLASLLIAGGVLTVTVVWGAVRYHRLSGGRWGLISDNSTMTRLWADTNYGRVHASWRAPDGAVMSFLFESPPKAELGLHRELEIEGYIGDSVKIDAARRNEVHYMTLGERLVRWAGNVRLLFVDNTLWPDSMHQGNVWRRTAFAASQWVLLGLLGPLAMIGIASCAWRPKLVSLVCAAHVLTMIYVAAFFYAEQRYRVPYDIAIVILALEGGMLLASGIRGRLGKRTTRS